MQRPSRRSTLPRAASQVIAVEKDPLLASDLRERYAHAPHGAGPSHSGYRVFANIPFDLTASIVNRLTRAANAPDDAYLVIQREAAERFAGSPRCTLLAALAFPWFETTVVHEGAAWRQPRR